MIEGNAYTYEDRTIVETVQPVRYAGFWMRFWAYLLDLLVVGSINRLIIHPIFRLV